MPQIDFGHLYKFIASAGIVLIVSAVIVPWLFSQSIAVLSIPNSDIQNLTPVAQGVIGQRQNALAWFQQNILVVFSVALFLGGCALLVWGISRWRSRQAVLDGVEDLDLSTRRAAFESATPGEVDEKRGDEVDADLGGPAGVPVADASPEVTTQIATSQANARVARIEQLRNYEVRLSEHVHAAFGDTFSVNTDVRLKSGDGLVLDMLLDSDDHTQWGQLAIDVRVVQSRMTGSRIWEAMMRMAIASRGLQRGSVYTGRRGRPTSAGTTGIVVFVIEGEDADARIDRLRERVAIGNEALKWPIGVLCMFAGALDSLSPEALREAVSSVWANPQTIPMIGNAPGVSVL